MSSLWRCYAEHDVRMAKLEEKQNALFPSLTKDLSEQFNKLTKGITDQVNEMIKSFEDRFLAFEEKINKKVDEMKW